MINIDKSFTFCWIADKKRKRILYDSGSSVKVDGRQLKSLKVIENFVYLGVIFSPVGRVFNPATELRDMLAVLAKSPLKPQQKAYILRIIVIPKFLHQLVLGRLHLGSLKKLDLNIRTFLRKTLRLSHDLPNSSFYCSVADGGMGIPCLPWGIPMLAHKRLQDIVSLQLLKHRAGERLTTQNKIYAYFKKDLYSRCDGKGLTQSSRVPEAHAWISDGTRFLSGRDISSVQLRYNWLYNKSRAMRGREGDIKCRRGCNNPETHASTVFCDP